MRVLYVNPGVQRHGGAERTLTGLLDGLDGMGVEPRVVVFGEGDLSELLRERGVGVVVVPIHGAFRPTARYQGARGVLGSALSAGPSLWAAVREIRAEARRFGADIVHSNGTRAHLLAPFLGPAPTVATLHDLPQSSLERRIVAGALARVDTVIANSPMVARAFPHVRCRVIDNPVAQPAARDRGEARLRLGVPDDAFTVAILSHFHWYKGQLDLIQACTVADPYHLVLAGGALYGTPSAEYLERARQAAAASPARDRIHFAGIQDDVSWVYAAADVVAHCSVRPEPFGMAIVEALLSGTPVVASAAGTPGEMLEDGKTALLYPPGDVGALGRALDRVRAQPGLAEELGRNGQAWAADRFTPARHARAVLDVYEALADSRRRQADPAGSR